jgi:hypothetical protein
MGGFGPRGPYDKKHTSQKEYIRAALGSQASPIILATKTSSGMNYREQLDYIELALEVAKEEGWYVMESPVFGNPNHQFSTHLRIAVVFNRNCRIFTPGFAFPAPDDTEKKRVEEEKRLAEEAKAKAAEEARAKAAAEEAARIEALRAAEASAQAAHKAIIMRFNDKRKAALVARVPKRDSRGKFAA